MARPTSSTTSGQSSTTGTRVRFLAGTYSGAGTDDALVVWVNLANDASDVPASITPPSGSWVQVGRAHHVGDFDVSLSCTCFVLPAGVAKGGTYDFTWSGAVDYPSGGIRVVEGSNLAYVAGNVVDHGDVGGDVHVAGYSSGVADRLALSGVARANGATMTVDEGVWTHDQTVDGGYAALYSTAAGTAALADFDTGINETYTHGSVTVVFYEDAGSSGVLGLATESLTALGLRRVKRRSLGQPSVGSSALSLGRVKRRTLGQPNTAATSATPTRVKRRTLATPATTDTALPITAGGPSGVLGLATESLTALGLRRVKRRSLGQPSIDSSALSLGRVKRRSLGQPASTGVALSATRVKRRSLGLASVGSSALSLGRVKRRSLGQPNTSATSATPTRVKRRQLGQPTLADDALAIALAGADGVLGLVTESLTALGLRRVKRRTLGQPSIVDATLGAFGRVKRRSLGQPSTASSSQIPTRVKRRQLGLIVDALTALGLTRETAALGLVTESLTALGLRRVKRRSLGQPSIDSSALSLGRVKRRSLGQPASTGVALSATRVKRRSLGLASVGSSALSLGRVKRRSLGQPSIVDATLGAFGRVKRRELGIAAESLTALGLVLPAVLIVVGDMTLLETTDDRRIELDPERDLLDVTTRRGIS